MATVISLDNRIAIKKYIFNIYLYYIFIINTASIELVFRVYDKINLVKEIIFHKRNLQIIIAISKLEKLNLFYLEFIPDSYIYSNFSSEILTRLFTPL